MNEENQEWKNSKLVYIVTHIAATEMFFVILFELPALENSPLKFKKAVHNFKIFFPVFLPYLI